VLVKSTSTAIGFCVIIICFYRKQIKLNKPKIDWAKLRQMKDPDPGREIALFTPLEGLIQAFREMPGRRKPLWKAFVWALKNGHLKE